MGRPRALTDVQALTVLADAKRGIPQVRIAKCFGVSSELVSRIVTGESYSDVTGVRRSFGTGPGQQPCCLDARCDKCRLNSVQDRNLAVVRAFPTYVGCIACGQAITRTIGVVLNARGLVGCTRCGPLKPTSGHTQCTPQTRCQKCRTNDAREENLRLARATEVDVECVPCVSTITRQAGLVLDSHGLIRCRACTGRRK